MEAYSICRDLAIIIVFAKVFGILAQKCKAPQVVGEIIAGLVIGPCLLGIVNQSDLISGLAELGVIFLMFSAGLETNLKELVKTGPVAFLTACAGVIVPMILGAVLYMSFYGFSSFGTDEFYKAVFMGSILSATSVSITVQALREMGRLKGKVGTTILSAAIIDDVIGIILLTVVIGFKDPNSNPLKVLSSTGLFFLFAAVLGIIAFKFFKFLDSKYPHTRRIPILGLALCLALAYVSEQYFGIADITGAYVAGLILCSINDSEYIAKKMDVNSYMLFGPIFFASIGLKTTISHISWSVIVFAICFVIVGLLGKIIGCGLTARIFGFNKYESLEIGLGMMTRGEVALIVAQKGMAVGLMDSTYFTAVILLIVVSSVVTPILLKTVFAKADKKIEAKLPS